MVEVTSGPGDGLGRSHTRRVPLPLGADGRGDGEPVLALSVRFGPGTRQRRPR